MWNTLTGTLSYIWPDVWYWQCVSYILYPAIIAFSIVPLFLIGYFTYAAIYVHLYRYMRGRRKTSEDDFWHDAGTRILSFWRVYARIWHDHEFHGVHHVPDEGPALLILYHGTIPVDFYILKARYNIEKQRNVHSVTDNILFRIPGMSVVFDAAGIIPGDKQRCVDILKEGHLLVIAPGGTREGLYGDENYLVMWGNRRGFAKLALQAQVPIIPVFTQNIREASRTLAWGRRFFRWVYEKYRLPLVLLYGFFPVKLRTYFGPPIIPDSYMTCDELAQKVKEGVESLIRQHQIVPGSIKQALKQRLRDRTS